MRDGAAAAHELPGVAGCGGAGAGARALAGCVPLSLRYIHSSSSLRLLPSAFAGANNHRFRERRLVLITCALCGFRVTTMLCISHRTHTQPSVRRCWQRSALGSASLRVAMTAPSTPTPRWSPRRSRSTRSPRQPWRVSIRRRPSTLQLTPSGAELLAPFASSHCDQPRRSHARKRNAQ